MEGIVIGAIGIALCVLLCGTGSAVGLFQTGRAAAGVLAQKPKKFGSVMFLAVLPATQGIYGFVIGMIAQGKLVPGMSVSDGWLVFAACFVLAISGLASAIFQGKTAVGGLNALAKSDCSVGKLILFPAMVETYAILALVISIIMLQLV